MRYREIIEAVNAARKGPNAAEEQQKRAKANQSITDARRLQNNALRRLHDQQAKAAEANDPTKAADAMRAFQRARSRAATKTQAAQGALSKPS